MADGAGEAPPAPEESAPGPPPLAPMVWTVAQPYSLVIPLLVATAAFVLTLIAAPDALGNDARHAKFESMFATTAQVIATLFIALALEARYVRADVALTVLTVSYVGVGVTASVVAGSPSLPGCLYGPLLALGLSGGAGALTTEERKRNRAALVKRLRSK